MGRSAVAHPEDRHFLGFSLRREAETGEVEVRLSQRSQKRIREKVVELTPRTWGKSLRNCIKEINQYLVGWVGYFGIISSTQIHTLEILDAHLRRRLRAIQLKQWKRKSSMLRALMKLGVSKKLARGIYMGKKSLWTLSHHIAVDRGLRNAYFAKRGLKSLADLWRDRYGIIDTAPAQAGYR